MIMHGSFVINVTENTLSAMIYRSCLLMKLLLTTMHNNTEDLIEYKFFSFLKIHYLLALYFLACSFSIAFSQIILSLVAFLWIYGIIKKPDMFKIRRSPLDLFIAVYVIVSILAIIFSLDPVTSISHAKHIFLCLIFFFGVQALTNPERVRLYFNFFIAGGVINCFYALFRHFFLGEGGLEKRLHGFISSWMTFSSFMMMILLILLAKLIWKEASRRYLKFQISSAGHKDTEAQRHEVFENSEESSPGY